ncbi:hypothetical protein MHW47_00210 [Streptomyces sp. OfavH-34-F]|uniref:hypothetical protein n=1 Tax=Streptomyces sp. OfavH-34-F TaxID=2917760 RepID=UPI001EF1E55A|nr:hypothetical protein [Streptomyces sp. OfavH-34-F]MCG7522878.1 hypothetical protein [Streptomyces sp. OfavH-34-F]
MTPPRRAKANSRNRQQLAKALRDAAGCTYQQALQRVEEAAVRGLLPAVLHKAGRQEAVRLLSTPLGSSGPAPAPDRDETAPRRSSVVPGAPGGGSDKTMIGTGFDHARTPADPDAPFESLRIRVLDLDARSSLEGPWRDSSDYVPVILDVPPPGTYDPGVGLSPAERDEILRRLSSEM